MSITKKLISGADFRFGFPHTSQALGFPPAKINPFLHHISYLLAMWRSNLEVEIYTQKREFQYGRIKSSRYNNAGKEFANYASYFHTRVAPSSEDPLLIITFEPVAGQHDFMFIEAIIDHRLYFGSPGTGKSPEHTERRSSDLKRRIENAKKLKDPNSIQNNKDDESDEDSPSED